MQYHKIYYNRCILYMYIRTIIIIILLYNYIHMQYTVYICFRPMY